MRLDDKRAVIEALLCASGTSIVSTVDAAEMIGVPLPLVAGAIEVTYGERGDMRFNDRQIEAAYRLIESSPTLRREWFGAR